MLLDDLDFNSNSMGLFFFSFWSWHSLTINEQVKCWNQTWIPSKQPIPTTQNSCTLLKSRLCTAEIDNFRANLIWTKLFNTYCSNDYNYRLKVFAICVMYGVAVGENFLLQNKPSNGDGISASKVTKLWNINKCWTKECTQEAIEHGDESWVRLEFIDRWIRFTWNWICVQVQFEKSHKKERLIACISAVLVDVFFLFLFNGA